MNNQSPPIVDFYGEFGWLAPQSTVARIELDGLTFESLEAAMCALKFSDHSAREWVSTLKSWDATKQSAGLPMLGTPHYVAYHNNIVAWVADLVAQKFALKRSSVDFGAKLTLAHKLLKTSSKEIIWRNYQCDTLFGICSCIKHCPGVADVNRSPGQNLLGKLMVLARKKLQAKFAGSVYSDDCWQCWAKKHQQVPGTVAIAYWVDGALRRYPACRKHESILAKQGKRECGGRVYHIALVDKEAKTAPNRSAWPSNDSWEDYQDAWAEGTASTTTSVSKPLKKWTVAYLNGGVFKEYSVA